MWCRIPKLAKSCVDRRGQQQMRHIAVCVWWRFWLWPICGVCAWRTHVLCVQVRICSQRVQPLLCRPHLAASVYPNLTSSMRLCSPPWVIWIIWVITGSPDWSLDHSIHAHTGLTVRLSLFPNRKSSPRQAVYFFAGRDVLDRLFSKAVSCILKGTKKHQCVDSCLGPAGHSACVHAHAACGRHVPKRYVPEHMGLCWASVSSQCIFVASFVASLCTVAAKPHLCSRLVCCAMHMSHLAERPATISATDWHIVSHTLCL